MGTSNSQGRGFLVALVEASMAIAASPAQAARREAIDNSGWKQAQEADRIAALPGQPPEDFGMYAGYITANKEAGRGL